MTFRDKASVCVCVCVCVCERLAHALCTKPLRTVSTLCGSSLRKHFCKLWQCGGGQLCENMLRTSQYNINTEYVEASNGNILQLNFEKERYVTSFCLTNFGKHTTQ